MLDVPTEVHHHEAGIEARIERARGGRDVQHEAVVFFRDESPDMHQHNGIGGDPELRTHDVAVRRLAKRLEVDAAGKDAPTRILPPCSTEERRCGLPTCRQTET